MQGRLEWIEIDAPSLVDNPLGDPARRHLLVYLPADIGTRGRLPVLYFLHGFTGSARSWTNFSAFQPTVPERLDALIADGSIPPVMGVFVDGWTKLGGSQWLNSEAIGRYRDYVARDVLSYVDSRYPTIARADARGVLGTSSGGYGALVMGSRHPDVFGHVGSHAGDAGFEYCYLPDFPAAAAALEGTDAASWIDSMLRRVRQTKMRQGDFSALNVIAMAAAYSPNPASPLSLDLPFEPSTARLRDDVWARWLEHDPARFVPRTLDSFRRLGSVYLDCGTRDEFNMRWGTRRVAEALRGTGVELAYEEFDDGHRGIDYRYTSSVGFLAPRLART